MKLVPVLLGLAVAGTASATSLTLTMLADDYFEAYISTNDSVQGTQFLAQTQTWQFGAVTGTVGLAPGVTNYLHIRARDVFGAPSMIVGQASVSDGAFVFPNNSGSLLTNISDWKVSLSGFGSGYFTPTDLGANGSGPWGLDPAISGSARRIWSGQTNGEHYFSVAITPVPEPATTAIMVAGVGAWLRRRRQRTTA